jgi:hypothetical protein
MDDATASFFEVLTSTGKYYDPTSGAGDRIPSASVRATCSGGAYGQRDGPDGEVFSALYVGSASEADDRIRLGRFTD